MIKVSKNLKKLTKLLHTDIYIVGGYVRNSLLGYALDDIDIASTCTIEQIFDALTGTEFLVKIRSAKMGTVEIFIDNEVYQHTTFRSDSYTNNGEHNPHTIKFIASIKDDAKRRDFTINAIYYNINNGQLYDFYNGVDDLQKHTLKTVENPNYVFSADGLRLLRLVRFASMLNFEIDNDTMLGAKKYAKNLKSISGERKQKELVTMLNRNLAYSNANIYKGIKLLFDLNLIKYIFAFDKEYLFYELYDFSPVEKFDNKYRIYGFLLCFYSVLKDKIPIKNFVQIVTNKNALNFSKAQTQLLNRLIKAFSKLDDIKNMQMFIFNYYSIIDVVLEVLSAFKMYDLYDEMASTLELMEKLHTPFTLKELKINGNDLIKQFNLKGDKISYVLNACHKMCINNPKLNERKILLEKAKNFIK